MRLIPRPGGRPPRSVTAVLGLEPGERVVAWGLEEVPGTTAPGAVAATDRALVRASTSTRIPWDAIARASWNEPVLDVETIAAGIPAAPLRITLVDQRDLPAAVHDRVMASIVVSERLDLGGGAKATAVARRSPDDDQISWTVVFDAGLDPRDPALRATADELLARLRESLGV